MDSDINPFIYSRPLPPALFMGRQEIIKNCRDRLAGPVRTSIAISGEHGTGKTSLLRYLMHLAQEKQWGQPFTRNIFIYLDCQTIKSFTPTRFWQRVLELLKETQYGSSLHERIDRLLSQPEIDTFDIERLLKWLSRQGFTVVLMLDSFTRIVKASAAEATPDVIGSFLAGLRSLANQLEGGLTMLTTTREHLDKVCYDIVKDRPGSQFYNNFIFVSLPPFTAAEIETLLAQALANHPTIAFGQLEHNLLQRLAGAHPALVQMAAFHLFEARRQGLLDAAAKAKVIADFEREGRRDYLPLFWDESSPLEQSLFILIILAHVSGPSSLQLDITPEEIQHLFQRYELNLDDLIRRGLVLKTGGAHHIFSTIFAWWIVRKVAAENEAELADRLKTIAEEPLRRAWETFIKLSPDLTLDTDTSTIINRKTDPKSATPALSSGSGMPGPIPPRFQKYQKIGEGAYGEVYKAFDDHLKREVAIKKMRSDSHRLLKEAQTASPLKHPCIVTIYELIEQDDQLFLVMEYLEGQTLATLLQEKQRLPLRRVIALLKQAASALDFAHDQGVIHRDIKPANLMITGRRLKLTDFGIAKTLNTLQESDSTGIKGTMGYMSPEQLDQRPLDKRSDLFSLATVAFEMLSGSSPWGENIGQVVKNIASDNVLPRSLTEFDVPRATALDRVFHKALAKDPDERYQRGIELVEALQKVVLPPQPLKVPNYPTAVIRDLLKAAFNDQELDVLCYDHLRQVYRTFTDEMGFDRKIQKLLEYCERHEKMEQLLIWVKEYNPDQYSHFERRLRRAKV